MNILVIEDELRVAELIKRGLEEQGYQVTLAYDGEMGKKLALSKEYNLIITDIILPKINGLDLCKDIRAAKSDSLILMLTALGTTDDKVEGLDAGADDYLVKPFDLRELHARIRALLKRNPVSAGRSEPFLIRLADLEMNRKTRSVTRGGKKIELTPKENVWNMHFDTGTNFVDVYINYLRKKIDRDFSVKLIHTKSGMGFIFMKE
jgi:DNA-binding response OmpR family regulator